MTITEPMTLATDYLLAMFTIALGRLLGRAARDAELLGLIDKARVQRWWSVAFIATAVAGAAGGTVHGFQRELPRAVNNLIWLVTLESLVLAAFCVVAAAIIVSGWSWRNRFIAMFAAGVLFGSYGLWVIRNPVFLMAIVAYGAALAVLVCVQVFARPLDAAGVLMLAGVVLSVVAAGIQQSGVAIHRYFNHNDLYHVVQAIAIWLLYLSARRV